MRVNRLFILTGVPGSGKSTWTRERCPDAKVFSADDFFTSPEGVYRWFPEGLGRAHDLCSSNTEMALKSKEPQIVVDNTNIKARDRNPYIRMGLAAGYEVLVVVFPCPDTNRNLHGVQWGQVIRMQEKLNQQRLEPGIFTVTLGEKSEMVYMRVGGLDVEF